MCAGMTHIPALTHLSGTGQAQRVFSTVTKGVSTPQLVTVIWAGGPALGSATAGAQRCIPTLRQCVQFHCSHVELGTIVHGRGHNIWSCSPVTKTLQFVSQQLMVIMWPRSLPLHGNYSLVLKSRPDCR